MLKKLEICLQNAAQTFVIVEVGADRRRLDVVNHLMFLKSYLYTCVTWCELLQKKMKPSIPDAANKAFKML